MHRLIAIAAVVSATALGWPARADVLIGLAGPMTGKEAWLGEQFERGAELAVADVNAAGGVLGRRCSCDGGRLLRSGAGGRRRQEAGQRRCDLRRWTHLLRGFDPASEIYEAAGVLMISPYRATRC